MTGIVDPDEPLSVLESGAWYTVDHPSAVGRVRRAAVTTAARLGFDETRAAEVGLVVSELATNQSRHAGSGRILLEVHRSDGSARLAVLAVDSGPGMRDVAAAMRDGVSSRGTLGIGLGTLPRLAASWDAWSAPGSGTVVTAAFDARRPGGDLSTACADGRAAGITRAMTGQQVCGDAYAVRVDDGASSLLVSDGLGHGPLAAAASQSAVRAFLAAPAAGPAILLEQVHRALVGTRGAAVAVVQQIGSTVRHAGIGNIAGAIHGTRTRSLLSPPGIGGSRSPAITETTHPVSEGDVVTLYSDGLTDRVNLGDYPGLLVRSATVVAGVIMRDFAVRRDDACVVVLPVRGVS